MRWTPPIVGDVRYVVKFLWLPLRLENEVRWLELAHIRYVYRDNSEGTGWKPASFIREIQK